MVLIYAIHSRIVVAGIFGTEPIASREAGDTLDATVHAILGSMIARNVAMARGRAKRGVTTETWTQAMAATTHVKKKLGTIALAQKTVRGISVFEQHP